MPDVDRRTEGWGERGWIARALFLACLLCAGCATSSPPGQFTIAPSPQRQPTHQVVGETVVASLGGASVTVRWLSESGVEQFFESRPGLVSPWPKEVWKATPPVIFSLRVRNATSQEVQFDPTLAFLVSQDGRRERPFSYEEMYGRLQETEGGSGRLQSLQATLFSRFVVIGPGGQREGLLVFPTLSADAKHLLLELASFYVGGRVLPGIFEFQVSRPPKK